MYFTIPNFSVTTQDINTIYQVNCTINEGNAKLRHPTNREEAAINRNYLHLGNSRFYLKHTEKKISDSSTLRGTIIAETAIPPIMNQRNSIWFTINRKNDARNDALCGEHYNERCNFQNQQNQFPLILELIQNSRNLCVKTLRVAASIATNAENHLVWTK